MLYVPFQRKMFTSFVLFYLNNIKFITITFMLQVRSLQVNIETNQQQQNNNNANKTNPQNL